ncbi:MAG: flagellar biosynthetic protein FliO [Kiritimatiellae bacterium]|nr:flagellar biosynthetic protein FliO [Kiritimatiellia bacterium]
MAKQRWKLGTAGIFVLGTLLLPVYAQNDAIDGEFSFERLSEMEKRLEKAPKESKTVAVVENATEEVSATDLAPVLEEKTDLPSVSGRSMNMWRSLGALLIVLGGLIVANKWLQRRMAGRSVAGGGVSDRRMAVRERLSLDHRRQLVLITVGRREIVLAMGPNEMRPVAEWVSDEADENEEVDS